MTKNEALNLELPCIIIDEFGDEHEIIEIQSVRNAEIFICRLFYKDEDGTFNNRTSMNCTLKQ